MSEPTVPSSAEIRAALEVVAEMAMKNWEPEDKVNWPVLVVAAAVNSEGSGDVAAQDKLIRAIAVLLGSVNPWEVDEEISLTTMRTRLRRAADLVEDVKRIANDGHRAAPAWLRDGLREAVVTFRANWNV